jgi:hypothetical protein
MSAVFRSYYDFIRFRFGDHSVERRPIGRNVINRRFRACPLSALALRQLKPAKIVVTKTNNHRVFCILRLYRTAVEIRTTPDTYYRIPSPIIARICMCAQFATSNANQTRPNYF